MSPCYNNDPGAGFFPRDQKFATQEECEETCSQFGACCTPTGCEQRSRCDCKPEDGNVFMGLGVGCDPSPCVECSCDVEACGFTTGSTLSLTLYGVQDTGNGYGTFIPASGINGRTMCFEYDPTDYEAYSGWCRFTSRQTCKYGFNYVGYDPPATDTSLWLCASDGVVRIVHSWGVFTISLVGAGSCGAEVNMSVDGDFTLSGTEIYNFLDATAVLDFDVCTMPEPVSKPCCVHCTAFGESPANLPESIDVTLSNVSVSGSATYDDMANADVAGSYTLQRSGCGYSFQKLVENGVVTLNLDTLGNPFTDNGYKWRAGVSYLKNVSPPIAFAKSNTSSVVNDLFTCCVEETFNLEGLLTVGAENYPMSLDFEIHCD